MNSNHNRKVIEHCDRPKKQNSTSPSLTAPLSLSMVGNVLNQFVSISLGFCRPPLSSMDISTLNFSNPRKMLPIHMSDLAQSSCQNQISTLSVSLVGWGKICCNQEVRKSTRKNFAIRTHFDILCFFLSLCSDMFYIYLIYNDQTM